MNELKFNSQICTTKEQSQRLLELGLKPETADMYYLWLGGNDYRLKVVVDNNPLKYNMYKTYIPAWSLHRLLEILNPTIVEFAISTLEDAYKDVIYNISECVKNGYFNKEYLKQ